MRGGRCVWGMLLSSMKTFVVGLGLVGVVSLFGGDAMAQAAAKHLIVLRGGADAGCAGGGGWLSRGW